MSWSKLVSTRRSTVMNLTVQQGFPALKLRSLINKALSPPPDVSTNPGYKLLRLITFLIFF